MQFESNSNAKVIILKPLQNHDFSKIAKLVTNYTKKIILAIFKFGSKLVKRYPNITFSLFSKLLKNYTKNTFSIPTAPRSGAICSLFVMFVYFFGNFENNENVIFGYLFTNFDPNLKIAKIIFFV